MAEKKNTKQPKKKLEKKSKNKPKKESEKVSKGKIDLEESQPVINIGLVGHVDHGKTTLTEQLSGKWTDTHSEELKRGITIRLGYADASFRKCPKCKGAEGFTVKKICPKHEVQTTILRKVSFVDAPGHESLMATMLSGSTIMDGALLLVAANENCPQPQTREHLIGLEIAGIKNIVIVQNKIDMASEERTLRNYNQIKEFLKGTPYENTPIIPISAQHGVNINYLIEAIEEFIPTPKRNDKDDPIMFVARSFDINKPGISPEKLKGGVLGGVLVKGKLKVGDKIELRPGHVVEEQNQQVAKPIFAKITSVITGGTPLSEVGPGGSVGVLTTLDPSIVKSDSLTGNIVGAPGKLPPVWYNLILETHLLERVVGAQEETVVDPIKLNEILMLNVNSASTVGFVNELGKNQFKCKLKLPICAEPGSKVTISRRIGTRFRLIGYGIIKE
ncbi:MAG: translation initiation factor IF-2 subunit gamma [Nanoarchaeota archaeon]|nr:translation initiation factor IF-2 subunit gamma [Nanoarchaeota archaeon]MBU1030201.1 translation initiation factor IF-2 subunit gamma [Nanoarchaeota archaeon]MBU1849857.1 translation initiation factor IF-2 subunit gamma [Nanoarchaeota archaeon]